MVRLGWLETNAAMLFTADGRTFSTTCMTPFEAGMSTDVSGTQLAVRNGFTYRNILNTFTDAHDFVTVIRSMQSVIFVIILCMGARPIALCRSISDQPSMNGSTSATTANKHSDQHYN